MAKVTGPLMSVSASGKVADSLVFFPWKGYNVVRRWLVPVNPESGGQGDVRLVLGGLGRATRCVEAASAYYVDAVSVADPRQTWVSSFVAYIIANYMADATAYEAQVTELGAHAATADFATSAATLGLTEFDIAYKSTTTAFSPKMQLYMLGKYGIAKRSVGVAFDRSPFDTAMASWTATEVGELEADVQAA